MTAEPTPASRAPAAPPQGGPGAGRAGGAADLGRDHLSPAAGAGGGHYYGRSGKPTWDAVEAQLALLEEAEVVAFPSGMAAITAALVAMPEGRGQG